jgi:glycosyltransferase involved in cell wall biosynthesis
MNVLFDPQIFSLQPVGGISRYFSNLAVELDRLGDDRVQVYCPHYASIYLDSLPLTVFRGGTPIPPGRFWNIRRYLYTYQNLRSFKSHVRLSPPDIVHHTYYWPLPDHLSHGARVTTVHDMIDELIKPNPRKAKLKRRSIEQSDFVICVSAYTQKTLLDLYNIPKEKTAVVHLGCPEPQAMSTPLLPASWRDQRPYILYVGDRKNYKNYCGLIQAYASSQRLRRDFDVVCFGGGPFSNVERTLHRDLGLLDTKVRQMGGDDAALYEAYRSAQLFVYPSKYEGFGLPPLEAMSQGTPVACSTAASIPEVVGSAGEYFDPESAESIQAALESVLYSESRRQLLVSAGKQRVKTFSWQECARQTQAIYRTLI